MAEPRHTFMREASHPVTAEEENAADFFLQRLRDAATSDDVAFYVTREFTRAFRAFHQGKMSEADAKHSVVNLLVDEEPTMIDEFMQLFESCCHTRAWAGLPPMNQSTSTSIQNSMHSSSGEDHLAQLSNLEAGGNVQPPALQQSLSGIANISSAAGQEVGTVGGTAKKSRKKSRKSGSKTKGPSGKLEWQALAKRLVPEGRASYAIWFTVANIGIILAVFAYMAGDYATWVREHRFEFSTDATIPARSDQDAEELLSSAGKVPQYLSKWLDWQATWQTFSFEFLKYWGGRWAPALERGGSNGGGAWWLWISSIYIHQNLNHILSNLLLFVAMSVHLELNYGWWRLVLVWFISGLVGALSGAVGTGSIVSVDQYLVMLQYSVARICVEINATNAFSQYTACETGCPWLGILKGIGANLVSAAFESNCTLLVGASGAVFGFMGLFVADLVVNFESISWPFLRVLCIVLFVAFFVVNLLSDDSSPRVSHASHIGGLVCGLFPSLLFLPNIRNKRIRALKRQMATGEGPAAGATLNTRNELEQDLNRSLRASFWTRSFPINPLYILGGLFVIAVYIILPVYLYTEKLKDVCCDPDKGTSLSCTGAGLTPIEEDVLDSNNAAPGRGFEAVPGEPVPQNGFTPTPPVALRKLLAPSWDVVVGMIGNRLGEEASGEGSGRLPSGGEGGSHRGGDPWSHYIARG